LARIDKALTPPRRSADPKLGRNTIVGFRFLSPSAPGVCSETGVHLFYRERQIGGQAEWRVFHSPILDQQDTDWSWQLASTFNRLCCSL